MSKHDDALDLINELFEKFGKDGYSKALKFINNLVKKFGKGGYIFRGTTTVHSNENEGGIRDGINSTLYRWVVRKEEKEEDVFNDEEHENLKKIFAENKAFSPAIMEEEISNNARIISQRNTGGHAILTDLQHFGGKTNMIDFSRNIYVALFFACQSKFDKCGELIALNIDKFRREKKEIEIIVPADTKESERRAASQESVFVRPKNGYIAPNKCKIKKIPANFKKHILNYLRTEKGIEPNTIYNDLHGFIKNAKNNETASLYFYMGLTSQNKGDHKNAIVYYDKCIERNPNVPVAYNNRGNSYGELKKYAHAVVDYEKAILLNPKYAEAYNNQGNAYNNWGKFVLAMECYKNALLLKPHYAEAHNNRGNAYIDNEQYDLAVQDFEEAISIDSRFAAAHFNLGIALFHLKKFNHSIESYSKAISLKHNHIDALINRGIVYYFLKKNKRAIKDYDKAISLDPNCGNAYYNRGIAKKAMGDKEGAKADFTKAQTTGFVPLAKRLALKK